MSAEPQQQSLTIVVRGSFNPSIFQPLWFSTNELLPREEVEAADITFLHKKVASFTIGKFDILVDDSRMALAAGDLSQAPMLRDLAVGTLSILEHSPLQAIGLNTELLFDLDESSASRINQDLAPATKWSKFIEAPHAKQLLFVGRRPNSYSNECRIRVQFLTETGVSIDVNQHYQLATDEQSAQREKLASAIRALNEDWMPFLSYSQTAAVSLLNGQETTDG